MRTIAVLLTCSAFLAGCETVQGPPPPISYHGHQSSYDTLTARCRREGGGQSCGCIVTHYLHDYPGQTATRPSATWQARVRYECGIQ